MLIITLLVTILILIYHSMHDKMPNEHSIDYNIS